MTLLPSNFPTLPFTVVVAVSDGKDSRVDRLSCTSSNDGVSSRCDVRLLILFVTKEAFGLDLETPHGDGVFEFSASSRLPALPAAGVVFAFPAFAVSAVSFIGCVHGAYSSETGW